MIIDGHTHVCVDGSQPLGSIEYLQQEMTGIKTDMAVVFPLSVRFEDNLILADMVKDQRQLIPLAFIDPNHKEHLDQFRMCIEEKGMKGLKLHPTMCRFHIDDRKKLDGLMEYCDMHRLPIVIHCTSEDPYVHPYRIETMAKQYPHAKFQIAHMGAIWGANQAIEVAQRNENVYLDTGIASFNAIRRAINTVPDKVIMGADFPFYMYSIEQEKLKRAFVASEYKEDPSVLDKIMGGNCARFHGIGG